MATNKVTTEQVREAIEQLAAMVAAASISPQTVANILEMLRKLTDQEREKVIAIAEAKIKEIQDIGIIEDQNGNTCFCDSQGHIIFRLSPDGAEAKQFRILNGSGTLMGSINEEFFSSVLKLTDVIDNLTSTATNKPLSAKQGKILKELIETAINNLPVLDDASGDTDFVDGNNNIIAKVNADGVSSIAFIVKNSQGQTIGTINQAFFSQIAGLMSLSSNLVYDNGTFFFKDANSNVIFSVSPTETKLSSLVLTDDDKFAVIDNIGRIAFMVDANGIDAKAIGENLTRAVKEAAGTITKTPKMIVLGSSTVYGAGSNNLRNLSYSINFLDDKGFDTSRFDSSVSGNMPFWKILNYLIGENNINIKGLGVGGENIMTISARYGNHPALIQSSVILPASKDGKVLLASQEDDTFLISSFDKTSHCFPLRQGGSDEINPCVVEGIECLLTRTQTSISSSDVKYYLQRVENGDRAITLPAYTPIIPNNAKTNRFADYAIICNWYNGGAADLDTLVKLINSTISNCGCKDFIILDKYANTEDEAHIREPRLLSEYGDRYFSSRMYLSSNALYDIGLTPTTDADFTTEQLEHGVKSDETCMSIGLVPSSFWQNVYGIDGATSNGYAHMNRCGYAILAYKLYERMLALGMISNS